MGAFNLNPESANIEDVVNQAGPPQAPPAQPPTQQPQQAPPDQIKQGLDTAAQYYQQQIQANTPKPASGGPIRSLLQNFFSGMGESMMHEGGLQTPTEKAQAAASGLQSVANAQGMLDLHQQMASQYTPVPLIMDGKPVLGPDGKVINIPANHYATVLAAQESARARVQAAQTEAAGRIQTAGINQGMMMPIDEETRQVLGLPEGTTQLPLKQLNQAIGAKVRPMASVQGAADQFQVNRLTGQKTPMGVGNPRIAAVQERARLTPFETVEPGTNNPKTISALEALRTGAPKVPLGTQVKLGGQYAQFNDAYGILDNIDRMVGNQPGQVNFEDPGVRARVSAGYAAIKDPASKGLSGEILSNFLARQPIGASLNANERELVLNMAQGKAAATGLRGILGQAGSNEMQQRLDAGLFPGGQAVGSNEAIKQQTKATRGLLDRFVVGQPGVGLNAPGKPSALSNKMAPEGSRANAPTSGFAAWKAKQNQ